MLLYIFIGLLSGLFLKESVELWYYNSYSIHHFEFDQLFRGISEWRYHFSNIYTVKTGVLFQHLLRHRNSALASVISTLKSGFLSVKTTLRLSYRVLCLNQITLKRIKKTFKKTSLAEALFLCRNQCQNDTPVFAVYFS
jgi:hypothetical protein